MEAFFEEVLDRSVTAAFIGEVQKNYHYREEQREGLEQVARRLLPLLRREACWEQRIDGDDGQGAVYSQVLMTLGQGPDLLQEQYGAQGLLTECYMVESLSCELLLLGYQAYNRYVEANTGYHVAQYHFPGGGGRFGLEEIPKWLARFTLPVQCTEALYLTPKKSALFAAELTREKGRRCPGICAGCENRQCVNRMEEGTPRERLSGKWADMPLPYGYSRIFGRG